MKPRILIAEDNPELLAMLRWFFREGPYEADLVNTGILAGQRYRAAVRDGNPYDLLLFDHAMPMGLGLSVVEEIRRDGDWKTPVVLMTALNPRDVQEKAKELGVARVVFKPFDADELLAALSEVLGGGSCAAG